MILAQREGPHELTAACRQRAWSPRSTWMSPAQGRCPGCAQHRKPPGGCWGSRVGSVPPQHTSPRMNGALCSMCRRQWLTPGASTSNSQQQSSRTGCCHGFHYFCYNICSWKMYVIWTGVKKKRGALHCFLRLTFLLDKIHGHYFWMAAGNSCLIRNGFTYWHVPLLTYPPAKMFVLFRMLVLLSLQWKLCPPWYNLSYKAQWCSVPSKEEERETLSPWCLLTSHPALYSFPPLNSLQVYIGSKSKGMQ